MFLAIPGVIMQCIHAALMFDLCVIRPLHQESGQAVWLGALGHRPAVQSSGSQGASLPAAAQGHKPAHKVTRSQGHLINLQVC